MCRSRPSQPANLADEKPCPAIAGRARACMYWPRRRGWPIVRDLLQRRDTHARTPGTILLIVTVIVAERAVLRPSGGARSRSDWSSPCRATVRSFHRWSCELQIEARRTGTLAADHQEKHGPGVRRGGCEGVHSSFEVPARLCHSSVRDTVVVGLSTVLPSTPPSVVRVHFDAPTTGCSCVSRRTAFPPTRPPAGPCRDLRWTNLIRSVTPSGGRTTGFGAASSPPSARRPRMPASPLGAVRATLLRGRAAASGDHRP